MPTSNYTFAGFDQNMTPEDLKKVAAAHSKYKAYEVLQKYDPNDPEATAKAYAELNTTYPGVFTMHSDGNLMLTGDAEGYIGQRPLGYNGNGWDNAAPKQWQWFEYNSEHIGPNGEGTVKNAQGMPPTYASTGGTSQPTSLLSLSYPKTANVASLAQPVDRPLVGGQATAAVVPRAPIVPQAYNGLSLADLARRYA